jgi:hypothetical protein
VTCDPLLAYQLVIDELTRDFDRNSGPDRQGLRTA